MIDYVNQFQMNIARPPIRGTTAILFYFTAFICY